MYIATVFSQENTPPSRYSDYESRFPCIGGSVSFILGLPIIYFTDGPQLSQQIFTGLSGGFTAMPLNKREPLQ
jgi:hypothetical protein